MVDVVVAVEEARVAGDDGVGAATTVPYVQSFAFRDGNQYGLVLFNLDLIVLRWVPEYLFPWNAFHMATALLIQFLTGSRCMLE